MKKNKDEIKILKNPKEVLHVTIKGDTSMIIGKCSDRNIDKLYGKQSGQKTEVREIRKDPEVEAEESMWRFKDGRIGFPAMGFMKGMIEHYQRAGVVKKNIEERNCFCILTENGNGLVPIKATESKIFDKKIVSKGQTESFRKIFNTELIDWECELDIEYEPILISPEQICNLLVYAGNDSGIGANAPRHRGQQHGKYHVEKAVKI